MLYPLHINYQRLLEALADNLDISPTQIAEAKSRYNAVGEWLAKEDSPIAKYKPKIYPQGSFRLGTVIKPMSEEDEFDVDLVCRLLLNTQNVTQEALKKMVGDRLKEHSDYKRMLCDKEGRRCWRIDYSGSPNFHLDILPAIPDGFEWLIRNKVPENIASKAICITDSENISYSEYSDDWNKSNPVGYSVWFKAKMITQLTERRKLLSERRNVSVEQIQDDEVKTPLQRAIQILKRHRDLMFGDDDDRPISIIITTLAAHAYSEEGDLVNALTNILNKMPHFIKTVNGKTVVENPVNPLENFADKWDDYPQRERNFREWMEKAKEDIVDLIERNGLNDSIENLREVFGERMMDNSLKKAGLESLTKSTSILSRIKNLALTAAHKAPPAWPMVLNKRASISAHYKEGKKSHTATQNKVIPKNRSIYFVARTNVSKPYSVYWQVVNMGNDAVRANGLRGEIFPAKTAGSGGLRHKENTEYSGTHTIECYIIKNQECVAKSEPFFVNIQ
ncbi:MAG: hypothetical protein ACI85O_002989 [Saprospiraceae bacterium]|jgi:hypothetical protein